eukprot:m51a1_g1695 putative trimethylguanosine synthase (234) ;mRNA; r:479718-480863
MCAAEQKNRRRAGGNVAQAQANGCPRSLLNYWNKRYDLFSRFDSGITLDEESWYSVTPERIAEYTALRCHVGGVVVDGFCGAGGNSIAFARCRHVTRVVAVDIDAARVGLAQANAGVYGVAEKIEFGVGDFCALASAGSLAGDVCFLSPPWGGPSYRAKPVFSLHDMVPDGVEIFKAARKVARSVVYYLPRNVDVAEIAALGDPLCELEVVCVDGVPKATLVYFGEIARVRRQ